MPIDTFDDQFYSYFFIVVFALRLAGVAVLCLGVAWYKPTSLTYQTQRKRYVVMFFGFIVALAALIALLVRFSPSEITRGIRDQIAASPGLGWDMVVCLVLLGVTIVAAPLFIWHFYRQPTRYAKYDIRTRGYVTTELVRLQRG